MKRPIPKGRFPRPIPPGSIVRLARYNAAWPDARARVGKLCLTMSYSRLDGKNCIFMKELCRPGEVFTLNHKHLDRYYEPVAVAGMPPAAWEKAGGPETPREMPRDGPDAAAVVRAAFAPGVALHRQLDALGLAGKSVQCRRAWRRLRGRISRGDVGAEHQCAFGCLARPKLAANRFEKAALKGHAAAQFCIGVCYLTGFGRRQNFAAAARWFIKSAANGFAPGLCAAGECFCFGLGRKSDVQQAFRLFAAAAEAGLPRGQYRLAECHHYGWGTPMDMDAALRLYTRAAVAGFAFAQCRLGQMYQHGMGVVTDLPRAAALYLAASDADADAILNRAWLYAAGAGVQQDGPMARRLWRRAAELGNRDAMSALATLYYHGRGVRKSWAIATAWHDKAYKSQQAMNEKLKLVQHDFDPMEQFASALSVSAQGVRGGATTAARARRHAFRRWSS